MLVDAVASRLAQNLNLVKKFDPLSLIHINTKQLTFSLCNVRDGGGLRLQHKRLYKPALDQPGVQTLCSMALDVMHNRAQFAAFQQQTNGLIGVSAAHAQHAAKFKVDEILLLLCPYTAFTDRYSRWFRVNHSDFSGTLAVYTRHLLANLPDMSLEQLYFTLVLFRSLGRRFAAFKLYDHSVLSSLISKLIFFAENLPKTNEPAPKVPPLQQTRFSAEIKGFSATLQAVYNCYLPYFRMIYTSYDAFRLYTDYLAKAAVHVQLIVAQHHTPQLARHFEDLTRSLTKLINHRFLKLGCLAGLVKFFARNRSLVPRSSSQPVRELLNKLAISLHGLTAHSYVALDDPQPETGDFVDVALRMVARVLEPLHIRDTVRLLSELERAGLRNRNVLMLLVPYVVLDLPHARISHLVELMVQLTDAGVLHWLLWVVLCRAVDVPKLAKIDAALRASFFAALAKQNERLPDAEALAAVEALRFVHVTEVGGELGPERYTPLFAILKTQFELEEPDLQALLGSYARFLAQLDAAFSADAVGRKRQRLESLATTASGAERAEAQI